MADDLLAAAPSTPGTGPESRGRRGRATSSKYAQQARRSASRRSRSAGERTSASTCDGTWAIPQKSVEVTRARSTIRPRAPSRSLPGPPARRRRHIAGHTPEPATASSSDVPQRSRPGRRRARDDPAFLADLEDHADRPGHGESVGPAADADAPEEVDLLRREWCACGTSRRMAGCRRCRVAVRPRRGPRGASRRRRQGHPAGRTSPPRKPP